MDIIFELRWFDKTTDELVDQRVITHLFTETELKLLLREKRELCGCYPLSKKQSEYVQKRLLMKFSEKYEYFIEVCGDYTLDLRDCIFTPAPASEFTDKDPIDRLDAEKAFSSTHSKKILDALIRVTFFDPEPFYIQEKCLQCLKKDDINIQREAIICIGHLARIHGKVDVKKVVPLLKHLENNPELAESIEEVLDDIEEYLKVKRH